MVATGTSEMHWVGQGATHKLQPEHRSLITVCMARVAPTMASTNAVRLVNYREHAGRLRFLCIAVDRLRVDVQQGGDF